MGIAGVGEWSSSVAKDLALSTDGRGGGVLGGGEFNGEFRLGSGNLGGVLDWGRKSDSGGNGSDGGDSGLGSGDSGGVIGLGSGNFGSVLDREGCYRIVDGSDGQVVGQDAEASGVGGVGDTDFLAFRVDVSVAANLVAETVTEVGGGLSGVSIAEAGLTELVLGVVLGGRVRGVAVSDGIGGGDGGSCGDSGVGRGGANAGVRIVSTVVSTISGAESVSVKLSLGGNSQHQQTGNRGLHCRSRDED